MKTFKKVLALFLCLAILAVSGALTGVAGEAPRENGFCGDNAQYVIGEVSNKLTVFGSGKIDSAAFRGRSDITEIEIKGEITEIGAYAFADCVAVEKAVIGDSVLTVAEGAFSSCSSLSDISFGNQIVLIGSYAFEDCSKLEAIVLPDTIEAIGSYTFANCNALTEINLPDSLKTIGYDTFFGCKSLVFTIDDSDITHDYVVDNYYNHKISNDRCDVRCHVHTHIVDVYYAPTCTENGYSGGQICEYCFERAVTPEEEEAAIVKAPTVIPATGHKEIYVPQVDPTCNKTGITAYVICDVCKEYIGGVPQQIPATEDHQDADNDGICDNCRQEIDNAEIEESPIKSFIKMLGTLFDRLFELFKRIFG